MDSDVDVDSVVFGVVVVVTGIGGIVVVILSLHAVVVVVVVSTVVDVVLVVEFVVAAGSVEVVTFIVDLSLHWARRGLVIS